MLNELSWKMEQWYDGDKRHLKVELGMWVKAYVRQTRLTKFRGDSKGKAARDYQENQAMLRDTLVLLMLQQGYEMFGKVPPGCSIMVEGPRAMRPDLSKLEKAVEDAANGALWYDDRWIHVRGSGYKAKTTEDRLMLHIWEI